MQELKERGNDNFNILVLHPDNFKLMVSRGFIKEIGNITFLFDKYTNLWYLVNSNFHLYQQMLEVINCGIFLEQRKSCLVVVNSQLNQQKMSLNYQMIKFIILQSK